MPQDKTAEFQAQIREKQNKLSLDARDMYSVLLGRPIVESMIEQLGDAGASTFLTAHEKFDRALERAKNVDIFELVPVHDLLAFGSFREYVSLLRQLDARVKMITDDEDAKIVQQALAEMLKIASQQKPEEPAADDQATASAEYGQRSFQGLSLPALPINKHARELLPYSYPDFDTVLGIVTGHFNKANFGVLLSRDLNACMKKSLNAVALQRKYVDHVESDYRDYVIEAQRYLIDRNWLRIGLDDTRGKLVSAALATGATVTVDEKRDDVVIACGITCAYATLGVSLETVLRRAIYALFKDVIANYVIEGRQAGLSVAISCCSLVVQDAAKEWLLKLHDAFDKANSNAA
jgi:hypothetical protein